jgi:guanylate kinase
MWGQHDSFLELVADKWTLFVQGSPMFILCKKLQHLKRYLKDLNKLHFSHILERVSRAEMELETHQTAFHYDKDNLQHLALDKQLRQKLFYLKSAKRLFFA